MCGFRGVHRELSPRFVEYGHHLLVGACFFGSSGRLVRGEGRLGGDAWLRGGCFAGRWEKDPWLWMPWEEDSLTFSLHPWQQDAKRSSGNASGSACCLVLWLSLPAARPYRTRLLAVPFVQQHRLGLGPLAGGVVTCSCQS